MTEDRTPDELRQAALELLVWAQPLTPDDLSPAPFSFMQGETVRDGHRMLAGLKVSLAALPGSLAMTSAVLRTEALRAYLGALGAGGAPAPAEQPYDRAAAAAGDEPAPFTDPAQTSLF